jgi:hypothetical protein
MKCTRKMNLYTLFSITKMSPDEWFLFLIGLCIELCSFGINTYLTYNGIKIFITVPILDDILNWVRVGSISLVLFLDLYFLLVYKNIPSLKVCISKIFCFFYCFLYSCVSFNSSSSVIVQPINIVVTCIGLIFFVCVYIIYRNTSRENFNVKYVIQNIKPPKLFLTNDCPICTEKMENSKVLYCGHNFHENCIMTWLTQKCECPLCKRKYEIV